MRQIIIYIVLSTILLSCNNQEEATIEKSDFNQKKWLTKEGNDYPYRNDMLDAILYNDSIRTLNKTQILALLGEPNRINKEYLYYTISQKRLGLSPLHTKTIIVKMSADNSRVDWIKLHE